MHAYVFPGQGAQYVGMGKDLFNASPKAKDMFNKANSILKFKITQVMFEGTEEDLKTNQGYSTCYFPAFGDSCHLNG